MAPGQLIMLQPPSKAANTIGILVIIYGALQGLGLMSLVVEPVDLEGNVIDYPFGAKMVDALSSVLGLAGFIAAGVLLTRYEKRGVYLAMSVIGVQFVLGILSLVLGSPDGGLAELIGEDQALAVYAGISGFCSGFCALLVAIPLMVSNNGLK